LGTDGVDAAHDHIVHETRIHSRTFDESSEYRRTEVRGVHSSEPAPATPDGTAYRFDEIGLSH
jgi:hypothetical protein